MQCRVKFVSRLGSRVPILPTGATSKRAWIRGDREMVKKGFDLWFALCILLGVVLILLAGFHRLGIDIQVPVISGS